MSPAPGGAPLYRYDLLEDAEEDSEIDWVDEGESEEEEDDEQIQGHTYKVAINVPDERRNLDNPCELNPARLQPSRMSFLLSGLLVMALTMLWLAFI